VVPTEKERLPIRIPVSVRGLNTFDFRRPYPSLRPPFQPTFLSYLHYMVVMLLHTGLKPELS
jgi:hypothetical protein